jgi:hypothetical protein
LLLQWPWFTLHKELPCVAFAVVIVVLLTALSLMWRVEQLWNFSAVLSNIVFILQRTEKHLLKNNQSQK